MYVVTVDLAVCLEDGGDCLINVNILDQAKLSKQICHWGTGFLNPGKYREFFIKKKSHNNYTLQQTELKYCDVFQRIYTGKTQYACHIYRVISYRENHDGRYSIHLV